MSEDKPRDAQIPNSILRYDASAEETRIYDGTYWRAVNVSWDEAQTLSKTLRSMVAEHSLPSDPVSAVRELWAKAGIQTPLELTAIALWCGWLERETKRQA